MPVDFLVLSAALLSGLMGGVHCTLMCGGIAVSLNGPVPPGSLSPAVLLNLGRITSYTLAGALAGGIGTLFIGVVRLPELAIALRSIMGLLLIGLALRVLFPRQLAFTIPGNGRIWRLVSGLKQHLPASGPLRSFGLGAVWGWLPCGLSSSLLLAAWLEANPLHSSLLMLAFGVGTLPLMTTISYSGARFQHRLGHHGWRIGLASMIFTAGLLTATAPWLVHVPGMQGVLVALGCRSTL